MHSQKKTKPEQVTDYRPLTLLNTDYRIYARILANRLKPQMNDIINETQFSAVTDRSIIDAASGVRDIIAAGQDAYTGVCLIVLDCERAFDNVAHKYLKRILD